MLFVIFVEYAVKCVPRKKKKFVADIEVEGVMRMHKLEDCNQKEAELYEEQVLLARSKNEYWLKMQQIKALREAIHFWTCKATQSKKKYWARKYNKRNTQWVQHYGIVIIWILYV